MTLTQPDANPAELVADALKQFLSRNHVHNDRGGGIRGRPKRLGPVHQAAAGRGQEDSGHRPLCFRQQIPFDLNDVIWDYQRMGGGSEESGFVLETEIGLFAMAATPCWASIRSS